MKMPGCRFALVAALTAAPAVASAQNAAFVVSVHGPWTAGTVLLERGDSLRAGSRIVVAPTADFRAGTAYDIKVWRLDGKPDEHSCRSRAECDAVAFEIPAALGAPRPLTARVIDAFTRLRTGDERYTAAQTRALALAEFNDAVVKLDGGRLFVGELLNGLGPGRYVVKLHRIDDAKSEISVDVDRLAEAAEPRAPKELTPGLYRAEIYRPVNPRVPIGGDAWWLIASGQRFSESEKAYGEMRTKMNGWMASSPEDVRAALRAYLDALSR